MDHGHQHARDSGPLVLDIGGEVGALVIEAPAGAAGREIEISPRGDPARRQHNVVRARAAGHGIRYAAVFPALPAGTYVVWAGETAAAGTVDVRGSVVASFRMPAARPAAPGGAG